jgi:hypothetical protein
MNGVKQTKINLLLQQLPSGALYFSSWLNDNGISYSLQEKYRKSGWLTAIDKGVMYRTGDKPTLFSALSCYNNQLNKRLHIGALSALELQGTMHYVPMGRQKIVIFCSKGEWFPKWFFKHDWGYDIQVKYRDYKETGLMTIEKENFEVLVSSRERAFLECLDMTPTYYYPTDMYYIMEMLGTIRPNLMQQLLEECNSIKIKRLFLYMAEKENHWWFEDLDLSKLDTGKGKRSISNYGVFDSKYQITIPRDLAYYE